MSGAGNTRREALADLRKNFQKFKSTNPNLPRPGSKSKVPVVFAATTRVDRHTELAEDFIKRVLGIEWAWISDESSLDDFHTEETNSALIEKIRSNYGVDVSDIGNGNLADIPDRIAEKAHSVPN